MPLPRCISLPYCEDSSTMFSQIAHWPGAIYLDSGKPWSDRGRYDIFAAEPLKQLEAQNLGNGDFGLKGALTDTLKQALSAFDYDPQFPFCGGAMGYISYEAGEKAILDRQVDDSPTTLPAVSIGIYYWAVVVDHQLRRCDLIAQRCLDSTTLEKVLSALQRPQPAPVSFRLTAPVISSMDLATYRHAFSKTQTYIQAGDCYQINLSREFTATYQGSPWQAYCRLRKAAAAPFSAYIQSGNGQLLCLSPERFMAADQGRIISQPIKGTAPRSKDQSEDTALATALQNSEKNRAENVMIVDLLRNDLSKSCQAMSVRVDQLCELHSFATVHHLVSTVSGQLKTDCSPFSALLNSFPGGSITGAPKKRAMEIIRELEPHRRGPYCGTVFYLCGSGRMDSNISIRSFTCSDGVLRAWSGGGIVADSECEAEFLETRQKMEKLIDLLADQ